MQPDVSTPGFELASKREDGILSAEKWLASLFDRHRYRPIPSRLVKKLARRSGIRRPHLAAARPRLFITFEKTTHPKTKWFWVMPSPTKRLLIASAGLRPSISKGQAASDLIVEMLVDGKRYFRDIWERARLLGIPIRTLNRAKKNLHVKSERLADGWVWYMTD